VWARTRNQGSIALAKRMACSRSVSAGGGGNATATAGAAVDGKPTETPDVTVVGAGTSAAGGKFARARVVIANMNTGGGLERAIHMKLACGARESGSARLVRPGR
jgi:hypothetical protein